MKIFIPKSPFEKINRSSNCTDRLCITIMEKIKTTAIADISVIELCEESNVNRMTFYRHYSDKYALLGDALYNIFSNIQKEVRKKNNLNARKFLNRQFDENQYISDCMYGILNKWRDYETQIAVILKIEQSQGVTMIYDVFNRVVSDMLLHSRMVVVTEGVRELHCSSISGALCSILIGKTLNVCSKFNDDILVKYMMSIIAVA